MAAVLPLVKLSVLRPYTRALRDRGVDPEPLFEAVGLSETATLDADLSVHVMVIHQFIENAAHEAGDPFLGADVGGSLSLDGWPILEDAAARAGSVGEYLSIFVARSNELASSVTAYLHLNGQHAVFGEKRNFEPTILPAQNDGFMAALAWAILGRAMNGELDPTKVTFVVSDPKVLPPSFDLTSVIKGDRMGFSVRFPSDWLSHRFGQHGPPQESPRERPPAQPEFVRSFRHLVRAHMRHGNLSVAKCADLASMSPQKLKRRLATYGTSASRELDHVRQEMACEALSDTDTPISQIAASLGYSDAANFTRAFRRAHGVTPSRFRASARPGSND